MRTVYDRLEILLTARDRTRAAFESVKRRFKTAASTITRYAKVAGVAIAAIGAVGSKSFAELERASRLTNTTIREFQELTQVIQRLEPGANVDKISEAVLSMRERFSEAREEAGAMRDLFDKIGLDSNLESTTEQLQAMREVFSQLGSDAERLQFTREILGDDDGSAMLEFLRSTNEEIMEIRENIREKGSLFTDEEIENMKLANRAVADLKREMIFAKDNVFAKLAPSIQKAANFTTAFIRVVQAKKEEIGDTFIGRMHKFVRDKLTAALKTAVVWVNVAREKVTKFFSDLGKGVNDASGMLGPGTLAMVREEGTEGRQGGMLGNIGKQFEDEIQRYRELSRTFINEVQRLEQEQREALGRPGGLQPGDSDDAPAAAPKNVVHAISKEKEEADKELQKREIERFKRMQKAAEAQKAEEERLRKLKESAYSTESSLLKVADAFGSIGEASSKGGSKAFKTFQRIQIALSTVAAISAGIKAASKAAEVGGPFAAFAAYASVVGALFGAISAMRSVSASGGGSTSPPSISGGNSTRASAPPSSPATDAAAGPAGGQIARYDITVVGDYFDGSFARKIAQLITDTPGANIGINVIDGLEGAT